MTRVRDHDDSKKLPDREVRELQFACVVRSVLPEVVLGLQGRIVRDAAGKLARATLQRAALVRLAAVASTAAATLAAARRVGAEAQVKTRGDRIELGGGQLAIRNVVDHLHLSC
jgi:hypothetical protein